MYFTSNGVKEDDARLCFTECKKPIYKMTEEDHLEYLKRFDKSFIDERMFWEIPNLDITNRAKNALARAGKETLGDIVEMTRSEFLALDNIGGTTLASIERLLDNLNLEFAQEKETSAPKKYKKTKTTVSRLERKEDGTYEIVKEKVDDR